MLCEVVSSEIANEVKGHLGQGWFKVLVQFGSLSPQDVHDLFRLNKVIFIPSKCHLYECLHTCVHPL